MAQRAAPRSPKPVTFECVCVCVWHSTGRSKEEKKKKGCHTLPLQDIQEIAARSPSLRRPTHSPWDAIKYAADNAAKDAAVPGGRRWSR